MNFAAFRALEGAEVWVRPDRVQYLKSAVVPHEGRQTDVTQIVLISEQPTWINVQAPIATVARELRDAAR